MSTQNAAFRMSITQTRLTLLLVIVSLAIPTAIIALRSFASLWTLLVIVVQVAATLLVGRLSMPTLIVGRDGLLVSRALGRSEFVAFADILDIDRYSEVAPGGKDLKVAGISLHLQTKKFMKLPFGSVQAGNIDDRATAPFECIRDALAAWQSRSPTQGAKLLERDGRPMERWIDHLRRLGGTEDTTYRVAATPIDRETLFAIAEDPANKASSRGAAAVALGVKLDDEVRTRLRVACETVADPNLRRAFEHVIQEEPEDDLEDVLQKLDPVQQV